MKVRALTYGRYHGKADVGSTRLRVHQLYKYWPEYEEYKYGENPDVLVLQKVYMQDDWKFIEHFENIKILDICDPDWMEFQDVKRTIDQVDGITCPTETMADFLGQMTDKPIKVIPDRHDVENLPLTFKSHHGPITKAVWFGYTQNAELLKPVLPLLKKLKISLTIYANNNPYFENVEYKKFDQETIFDELKEYDVAIFPQGNRPQDRFKSNNKTTLAWLAGLPVATDSDELEMLQNPKTRNELAQACYTRAKDNYDVKLSVNDMKEFIDELRSRQSKSKRS